MNIGTKVALACALVVGLLVAAQALMNARTLTEFHTQELEDDLILLASTIGQAAETFAQSGANSAEVAAYLNEADEKRRRTEISVGRDAPPELGRAVPRVGTNGKEVWLDRTGSGLSAFTRFESSRGPRWIRVERTGAERAQFERRLWQRQLYTLGLLVLVAAAAGAFVARRTIIQPIDEMMEHAKRIGDGDFMVPSRSVRNDELGVLQGTLDAMAVRLEQAKTAAQEFNKKRLRMIARLRHADRLSTVGRLASNLAHELGTPLNVVQGRAEMLAQLHKDDPMTAKHARVIAEQSARMSGLISELLDFSRRKPAAAGRMDVPTLVEQAMTLVEGSAEKNQVKLLVRGEDTDATVPDGNKVMQVLTNLLTNGIDAMPQGGVLEFDVAAIDVTEPGDPQSMPGRYVRFIVRDTGVGMDDETLAHALEPFFTTKKGHKGTGLGLPISHGITRELGGWIDIDSEPGRGTEFKVWIPAVVVNPQPREASSTRA